MCRAAAGWLNSHGCWVERSPICSSARPDLRQRPGPQSYPACRWSAPASSPTWPESGLPRRAAQPGPKVVCPGEQPNLARKWSAPVSSPLGPRFPACRQSGPVRSADHAPRAAPSPAALLALSRRQPRQYTGPQVTGRHAPVNFCRSKLQNPNCSEDNASTYD